MHNEKFHSLCSATDVIMVILVKTRRIRSTEGKPLIKKHYKILIRLNGRDNSNGLGQWWATFWASGPLNLNVTSILQPLD